MKRPDMLLVEDVLIILAIFSLWPTILGWQGAFCKVVPYLSLGAMVVVFVRRLRRRE
ncbi:MAG: hypothetical protein J7J76_00615 [Candidatus Latescibacteria bacterium]|nr:hypothetical protein [Candidatus Latescibacterota bacterium]